MRVIGQGIDLIECERIAAVWHRHGDRLVDRLLTPREKAYVQSRRHGVPHLAGRFAAKEAILKLLGTGWRGRIAWSDMEIINDPNGQPQVTLAGECARIAREKGIEHVTVSISHTPAYAVASAIGTGR